MRKQFGFTMIELIITVGMLAFLIGSIVTVYRICFRAFNAGEDRSKVRTQLAQTMELMTRDIAKAQWITVCNSTTLTFYADLGSGTPSTYSYSLSGSNLLGPTGVIKATGIQPQGTVVSWGTTPALFSCSSGVVTIDMTAVNNNETVHVKTNVRPRNIAKGLIGWWKLDDSAANTTVLDYSGNGKNGTSSSNTSTMTVAGQIGTALNFNGSSQYVLSSSMGSPSQSITVALWMKPGVAGGVAYTELGQGAVNSGWHDSQIEVETSGFVKTCVWAGYGLVCVNVTNSLTFNQWHHVVMTYDASTQTLRGYYDGKRGGSTVVARQYPGTLYYALGALDSTNAGNGNYFSGAIDDLRVYNRALNASEVEQLYQGN